MKLAIIVPSYNIVKLGVGQLEKMKEFISNVSNVEVVYVDDGSGDGTKEFIENNFKDPRVKVVSQKNVGLAQTRVNGIKAASKNTTHIIFVDADDNVRGDLASFMKDFNADDNTIFAFKDIYNNNGDETEFKEIKIRTSSIFERFIFRNSITGHIFPKKMLQEELTTKKIIFEDVYYILWSKYVEENFEGLTIKNIDLEAVTNVQDDSLSVVPDVESERFKKTTGDLATVWSETWKVMCNRNNATKQMRYLFIMKYISEYYHIAHKVNKKDISNAFSLMDISQLRRNHDNKIKSIKVNLKTKIFISLLRFKQYTMVKMIINKFMD